VTLSRERNPSISDDHSAEAVVHTKGPTLVAKESALTYEAAVDRLVDKLERQIERYRDKRTHEPRRNAQRREEAPPTPVEELAERLAAEGPDTSA
jgi:ribosome hibernation promoting factor